ncbi:MAG: 3-isopropylmalate dehydratase small subunit [Pseudomonadota bacterium]
MEPFRPFTGIVAPLPRANIDTDAIIPKQFLKSIGRSGFGPNLFDEWRYLDCGEPGQDCTGRPENPAFVLNDPRYRQAQILLTGENFGCGSSREHAPWALAGFGFRVILAPSFADIFFNNCFKNGLLPILLPAPTVANLLQRASQPDPLILAVDLSGQSLTLPDGGIIPFPVDSFRKQCLENGWDDIGLTLCQVDSIRAYETRRRIDAPWLFTDIVE